MAQFAQVAQSVEQWTENPCVGGSIPPSGTNSKSWKCILGQTLELQGLSFLIFRDKDKKIDKVDTRIF